MTTKKYQCAVCKCIENHSTNHFGEIYCSCKNCGNSSLQCIEPEAIEAREGVKTIKTKLNKYNFDISKLEERAAYKSLSQELTAKGLRIFNSINSHKWNYLDMLPSEIEIETDFVFDNQWNSNAGRVMDWNEDIYENKNLKKGYWLELTDEHIKAREPKEYECTVIYDGSVIGKEKETGINTSEASNKLYSKYYRDGMDIFKYKTQIELAK